MTIFFQGCILQSARPATGLRDAEEVFEVLFLFSILKPRYWVAAESLDAALRYMRQRHDDFTITEARFLGMIPLLSGSPLD